MENNKKVDEVNDGWTMKELDASNETKQCNHERLKGGRERVRVRVRVLESERVRE